MLELLGDLLDLLGFFGVDPAHRAKRRLTFRRRL
jgi:hypothetical protein